MSFLAFLSQLLPALLLAVPVARCLPGRSFLCLAALSWALGQVLATPAAYLLSCLLVDEVSPTLAAASKALLAAEAAGLMILLAVLKPRPAAWVRETLRARGPLGALIDMSFLAGALCFSYFLFAPHIVAEGGTISRSSTYWDFTAHYPIVQNFVFGDNFPAKDETAGELPLIYHFFGDLQIAIASALGTPLAESFLWVSALSLTSLLILLREFSRALFRSEAAGWAAALFAVTSSDLRWAFDLFGAPCQARLLSPLHGFIHPMVFSIAKCSFGDFNVSMFNLFYFVEERHVIFSSVLALAAALLLSAGSRLSLWCGAFMGALFALFCSWNVFLAPMLLLMLLPGLLWKGRRLGTIVAGLVLGGVCAYQAAAMGSVMASSGWFEAAVSLPKFNFGFVTANPLESITVPRFLEYYGFAIGPAILCAACGLAVMWRRARAQFWIFASVLLGTFVLINTVQAMPQSVYENHKWVKPWQGFLQIAAAAPVGLLLARPSFLRCIAAALVVAVMSVSGIAEAIPFFMTGGKQSSVEYPSDLIAQIRAKTRPSDVFVTQSPREVLMAGRRIYFLMNRDMSGTIPHLKGVSFRFAKREQLQKRLYAAQDPAQFCAIARDMGVSVVEFSPGEQAGHLFEALQNHVFIAADIPRKGGKFAYVSTNFCP